MSCAKELDRKNRVNIIAMILVLKKFLQHKKLCPDKLTWKFMVTPFFILFFITLFCYFNYNIAFFISLFNFLFLGDMTFMFYAQAIFALRQWQTR